MKYDICVLSGTHIRVFDGWYEYLENIVELLK
jgi:hypothetical protein